MCIAEEDRRRNILRHRRGFSRKRPVNCGTSLVADMGRCGWKGIDAFRRNCEVYGAAREMVLAGLMRTNVATARSAETGCPNRTFSAIARKCPETALLVITNRASFLGGPRPIVSRRMAGSAVVQRIERRDLTSAETIFNHGVDSLGPHRGFLFLGLTAILCQLTGPRMSFEWPREGGRGPAWQSRLARNFDNGGGAGDGYSRIVASHNRA